MWSTADYFFVYGSCWSKALKMSFSSILVWSSFFVFFYRCKIFLKVLTFDFLPTVCRIPMKLLMVSVGCWFYKSCFENFYAFVSEFSNLELIFFMMCF